MAACGWPIFLSEKAFCMAQLTNSKEKGYAIIGTAIHLAGFALGFAGQGSIQLGLASIDSGIAVLEPFGDLLYGLGLVVVVASATRSGIPMKYLAIGGVVIGIGLFYKSAIHEIHIASGFGFGLLHQMHVGIGAIMITIVVAALAAVAISRQGRQQWLGDNNM